MKHLSRSPRTATRAVPTAGLPSFVRSCDKTRAAMKVHECPAAEISRRYGVPTPRGVVVRTPEEARAAAEQLGGRVAVKAQIHAGGRGKGGGVKLAKDPEDAVQIASKIIGMNLVTHQTGPD